MDYNRRFIQLKQLLPTLKVEAILVENPIDLLYLTGLSLSSGQLLISEKDACLILDGRYFEKGGEQPLYPVVKKSPEALKEWLKAQRIASLGFDAAQTTFQGYQQLQDSINASNSFTSLVPLNAPIHHLRRVKDQDEIACLRKAALLNRRGCRFVIESLQEGITENQLARELEIFWLKNGGQKLAFDPIIAFKANASQPHYRAGETPLEKNMQVLIDIGVVVNQYASDMTRVVFFGEPSPLIQEIYTIVEQAKACAFALCRPGEKVKNLDMAARKLISDHGYGEQFTHSLGHGIGLETHEPPTLRSEGPYSEMTLEAGMVITIEPGIYLPKIGGVRLEDTILITDTGYEILS